ncbi:MAG: hypothetical protein VYC34_03065, partial [Planctomycetota bacterium]|nr:hypothetical protein [Planctomycetota bacterium]
MNGKAPESLEHMFEPAEGGNDSRSQEGILPLLHRRLRGRYALAAVAAFVFAVPFAILGYKIKEPQFTTRGLVQVQAEVPKLLYETQENRVPAYFDTLVATQAEFLQSERVLSKANEDARLHDLGWPRGPKGVAALRRHINVAHQR